MAELLSKVQELQSLDSRLHWFCERRDDVHNDSSSLPHESKSTNSELADGSRHELAIDCLMLFAYDTPDLASFVKFLQQGIDRQLGKCDQCILRYYVAKRQLLEKLRYEYEDHEVDLFSNVFDERDINRINRGLDTAAERLRNSPPNERGPRVMEKSSLYAIFEALTCNKFLESTELLDQHFQEPFQLIQTNKRHSVAHFTPGTTAFLFDANPSRCTWALQTWARYTAQLTKEDFEFAVRDPLARTLALASGPIVDLNFVQRLWCGIRLIIDRLDPYQITHSLRAMDVDVCRLTIDHLKFDTPGFRFLLQTVERLLEKVPNNFWDGMGAISPTTFLEQIFNNAQYDKFMMEANPAERHETSALSDMHSWIKPFMSSLQTSHQPEACRSLTFQLMDRLQAARFPDYSRIKCFRMGLEVLSWTLINCNKGEVTFDSVSRIVASDILNVTTAYIDRILSIPKLPVENPWHKCLAENCLEVIKAALGLGCQSLKGDQNAIRSPLLHSHSFSSLSPAIWKAVVHNLEHGNILLAIAALSGISEAIGLEKFSIGAKTVKEKEKQQFNMILAEFTDMVCQIFERINDFNLNDLSSLFTIRSSAIALVSALFSADHKIYEAGIELVKSLSAESARREALRHLLKEFFETTLESISWCINRIAKGKTFASCPKMLRTSTDVIAILCDSQDGLFRTEALQSTRAINAVKTYWKDQWDSLKVIYSMTERWGPAEKDNDKIRAFCRDTMEFSEYLFDQYSIFASAIDSAVVKGESGVKMESGGAEIASGRDLLKHPAKTMEEMAKWLRLRDEYLISVIVNLVVKVLRRLSEWKMTLSDSTSSFLEEILTIPKKTNLILQQKAELARALEENLGRPVATMGVEDTKQNLSNLSTRSSTPDSRSQSAKGPRLHPRSQIIDLEAWKANANKPRSSIKVDDDEIEDASLKKDGQSLKPQNAQQVLKATERSSGNGVFRSIVKRVPDHVVPSFKEKREQEIQAKKKRDADALAKIKRNLSRGGVNGQTAGEGSVLGSLGAIGREHVPKGSGMMVSSGSDTDSDDELDEALFGPSTREPKVSAAVKDYEASRLQRVHVQGPVKKTRQIRSAKDMRARLSPDLSSLHKIILSWDFFHNGSFPPNSSRSDYSLVTNSFRTPADYQSTFEPLLVLEAWQGFQKSREEGSSRNFTIRVANRLTVDSFIELSTTMTLADGKELSISEADIILMSKASSPTVDAGQPHCLARVFKITKKKNVLDISYRVNVGNDLLSSMVPNGSIYGTKVSSITPLEREYGALLGLKYYDLCDEIIKAKASPLLKYTDKQVEPIMKNYQINVAQAKSVKSAIDNDAFTLVQGPPGSGKTKTIVAIVGALLTSSLTAAGAVPIFQPQQGHGSGPRGAQETVPLSKKLLVCAPSNAAVDELVMRFKQGVKTLNGAFHRISIVRLGRSDNINSNVLDVTLEELVNAKLNPTSKKGATSIDEVGKLMQQHKATSEEFHAWKTKMEENRSKGETQTPEQSGRFEVLKRKKQELSNHIDLLRDKGNTAVREAEISRRRVQQEILDGAHVVCATLSGSGHDMFQKLNIEFETVIIDEAAQSIELSALIPLKYGCSKCIKVGDPKQLPPTLLSREAARFQYEQSLFVRMQANSPNDVHLLDIQYRMHPEISLFPSRAFYDNKLLDGPGMTQLRTKPWHESSILAPYRFFDVKGTQQRATTGHSLVNFAELEVALQLYHRLTTDCKDYDFRGRIGIITPYKSQLYELKNRFVRKYSEDILKTIEFNTTDAFQGRECEIIIFSCVRASADRGIGFLADVRRMNVGITRAQSSLWILGNSQSLMQGEFWGDLIENARQRNRYTRGNILEILQTPLLSQRSSSLAASKIDPDFMMTDAPALEDRSRAATSSSKPVPHGNEKGSKLRSNSSGSTGQSIKPTSRGLPLEAPSETVRPSPGYAPAATHKVRPLYLFCGRCFSDQHDQMWCPNYDPHPSGGHNGLDSTKNCAHCGSYRHISYECDDETYAPHCRVCKYVGHHANRCKTPRCENCLEWGHYTHACQTPGAPALDQKIRRRRNSGKSRDPQQKPPGVGVQDSKVQRSTYDGRGVPIVQTEPIHPPVVGAAEKKSTGDKRKRDSVIPSIITPNDVLKKARLTTSPNGKEEGDNNGDRISGTAKAVAHSGDIDDEPGASKLRPQAEVTAPVRRPMQIRKKEVDPFIRPKQRGRR